MCGAKPCKFCEILKHKQEVIYENELVFAFYDIKQASSQAHILVCPKQCIKNINHISKKRVSDLQLINTMYEVGSKLLEDISPNCQKRFGFHRPPFYSIPHLHLHCLILPIQNCFYNKITYGLALKDPQEYIQEYFKSPRL